MSAKTGRLRTCDFRFQSNPEFNPLARVVGQPPLSVRQAQDSELVEELALREPPPSAPPAVTGSTHRLQGAQISNRTVQAGVFTTIGLICSCGKVVPAPRKIRAPVCPDRQRAAADEVRVSPVPKEIRTEFKLAPFYTKYVNAGGAADNRLGQGGRLCVARGAGISFCSSLANWQETIGRKLDFDGRGLPATRTLPLSRRVAVCLLRAVLRVSRDSPRFR